MQCSYRPTPSCPATILIPVPQGATTNWVGEILGGDPTKDPERTYTTVQGTGGQALQVTLEQTRSAQAEFTIASTSSGGNVTANLTWIQSAPSTRTEFSVRMPAGVSAVQITPTPEGVPVTNELGESLYGLPTKVMKPGDTTVVAVTYSTGQAGQQGQGGAASSGSTILWVLIAALLLVLAILGFSFLSKRSQRGVAGLASARTPYASTATRDGLTRRIVRPRAL